MLDHPIVKKILSKNPIIKSQSNPDLNPDAYTKSMQIAALSEALVKAYESMGSDNLDAINMVHDIMYNAVQIGERIGYGA